MRIDVVYRNLSDSPSRPTHRPRRTQGREYVICPFANADADTQSDDLQIALSEFIAFPSVVGLESSREDCRQAALWLKRLLAQVSFNYAPDSERLTRL